MMNKRLIIVAISVAIVTMCATATVFVAIGDKHRKTRETEREKSISQTREEIAKMQYDEIIEALEMSEAQMASFETLYAEYMTASTNNRPRSRRADSVKMSNEVAEKMITESFANSRRAIALKEQYYHRFRKFLTPMQISTMYDIERRTRDRFVNELNIRRGDNRKRHQE